MLTRPLGRPKNRWEDDTIKDIKKLKIKNWTSCIQDRNEWKLYAEKVKTFKEEAVATKEDEEEYDQPVHIQICNFFLFGITAPNEPWPPHSRSF